MGEEERVEGVCDLHPADRDDWREELLFAYLGDLDACFRHDGI